VAAQFGVVTRTQLVAAGLHSYEITRRLRAGRLHRLHPGVYAVGHSVLVPKGRMLAAVLACGAGAALSHRSAATLHDLWEAPATHHVTVPRTGPHSRPGLVVHRSRRLDPADLTDVDGIPVTTIARTTLDLAAVLLPRQLAVLLDRQEAQRVLDIAALEATIARNPGRDLAALREALGTEAPSPLELQRRFLRLCRDHGLPEPEREAPIGAYRTDFFWPQANLAVETDGRAHHERRAAFERDRQRDLDLAACGIQTLRVTWRMVTRQAEQLAATLRARTV
jgi:very-short-patch-repair endonuclease